MSTKCNRIKPTQYTRKIQQTSKKAQLSRQTQPSKDSTTADHQDTLKKMHGNVKTYL